VKENLISHIALHRCIKAIPQGHVGIVWCCYHGTGLCRILKALFTILAIGGVKILKSLVQKFKQSVQTQLSLLKGRWYPFLLYVVKMIGDVAKLLHMLALVVIADGLSSGSEF